ncbi:hypothetical protein [Methylobacter sp.]|uniref:hypothetical protein n=1 Tax=Methylobacter sp. TaxID=2051955 RepID=UPI0024895CDD|nr:hypothetical protein [Methylobacter sp.]MDI1278593.1 hypothetical protein [Methylobacter sp.]MDI1359413.1 hypothetical protein [Methylobacter sp.]
MDVLFFLKEKTAFIRQLYVTTSASYTERIQKIQNNEEPFYSTCSGEYGPPFQIEYMEASDSLDALGYMCISMLAAALKLYLDVWAKQSRIQLDESKFNKGWLVGYGIHFKQNFNIDFELAPVSLNLIEEIILARNQIRHPSSIISHQTTYGAKDIEKIGTPLFVNECEWEAFLLVDQPLEGFLKVFLPSIRVTEESLLSTIADVERFSEWFGNEIESKNARVVRSNSRNPS